MTSSAPFLKTERSSAGSAEAALLTAALQASGRRRDEARQLELFFLRRLQAQPERLGLQTGADVHGDRRLEAQLACERLALQLDACEARGAVGPKSTRSEAAGAFGALLSACIKDE